MQIAENHFNCSTCNTKNCLLKKLSKSELEEMKEKSISLNVKAGDVIFRQNTPLSHVVHLKKGIFKTFIESRNAKSKSTILNFNKAGTLFGVSCTLNERLHQYSACSITDSTVCYIDASVFVKMLENNIKFSNSVLKYISNESIHLNMKLRTQMEALLPGKFAKAILYMSDVLFESDSFEIPFSKTELAQFVGASRERVSLTLKEFANDKIIELDNKKITIKSRKILERLSLIG